MVGLPCFVLDIVSGRSYDSGLKTYKIDCKSIFIEQDASDFSNLSWHIIWKGND